MEAKNLRIGNFVKSGGFTYGKECISKVVGIQANNQVNSIGVNWVGRTKQYSPIILSKAWLCAFGFDSLSDLWEVIQCDFYSEIRYDEYDNEKTKYVHELQNLFFALTGKELELKDEYFLAAL